KSRPFSCRMFVKATRFGASASMTPSSPTRKPRSLLESGPTTDDETVQNTMLPPAFTGAISMSPRTPIGIAGDADWRARTVIVIGLPALLRAELVQTSFGMVHEGVVV